jgi:hypothetical protein
MCLKEILKLYITDLQQYNKRVFISLKDCSCVYDTYILYMLHLRKNIDYEIRKIFIYFFIINKKQY